MQNKQQVQILGSYNVSSGAMVQEIVVGTGFENQISALVFDADSDALYAIQGGLQSNVSLMLYSTQNLQQSTLVMSFPSSWMPAAQGGQSYENLVVNGTFLSFFADGSPHNIVFAAVDLSTGHLNYWPLGGGGKPAPAVLWDLAVSSSGTFIGSPNSNPSLASLSCNPLGCEVWYPVDLSL